MHMATKGIVSLSSSFIFSPKISFDIYNKAVMTIADNLFKQCTYITRFRIINFFSYLSPWVSSALACEFV